MELTRKQEEGLRIAVSRYRDNKKYTVISGYAGTGKSTLISYIISALNLNPEFDVAYIAYTGKASEVLRRKGCANAMTAHKLLYHTRKTPQGGFITVPKQSIGDFKIIVVDEVSMLPTKMWFLLLRYGIHVLACGDPGQLPPITHKDEEPLRILDHPHIFLDEVMRQAQDSEIIRLSMDIREHKPIEYFDGAEVKVIPKDTVSTGMYQWADQILTATNAERFKVNKIMRELLGRGASPEPGDKVISLSNHWDIFSADGEANLVNGTIGYLGEECNKIDVHYPVKTFYKFSNPVPILRANFISEIGEEYEPLNIDYTALTTGKVFLNNREEYDLYMAKQRVHKEPFPQEPLEFNYGYAITVHRAQGSEWDKILVVEEKFPFDLEEHTRWLYTAVTRGVSKLVLAR